MEHCSTCVTLHGDSFISFLSCGYVPLLFWQYWHSSKHDYYTIFWSFNSRTNLKTTCSIWCYLYNILICSYYSIMGNKILNSIWIKWIKKQNIFLPSYYFAAHFGSSFPLGLMLTIPQSMTILECSLCTGHGVRHSRR